MGRQTWVAFGLFALSCLGSGARGAILAPGEKATDLALALDAGESVRSFFLTGPDRLVMDIKGARQPVQIHDRVQKVLKGRQLRQGEDKGVHRLVLELTPGEAPAVEGAADGRVLLVRLGKNKGAALAPVVAGKGLRGKVIVVDAGHGGQDPGALALNNVDKEKELVLGVALKLRDLLKAQGAQVIMTREGDTFPTLAERVALANEQSADLFLSIHANSLPWNTGANGTETYYFSGTGKKLAETVHPLIIQATGQNNRGVRNARFFVIRNTKMPSILIETGFVTHDGDLARLKDNGYQRRFAQAVAAGVRQYFSGAPALNPVLVMAPPVVLAPKPPVVDPVEGKLALGFAEKALIEPDTAWWAF